MGNKKKKGKKKVKARKTYPTNVEARAKEATALQPPDVNEHKMDNENNIDKYIRFKPKNRPKFGTIKETNRHKN